MIDLRPDHLEIVRDLLRQHVPECEVRAFGSRFKWTAKQASDLDLAVVGTKRLPTKKILRLKEAFEESILPMRVDVLDWHAITPEFQRVIDAGFEVIQGGEVSPLAPASSPSAAVSSATPLLEDSTNSINSWKEYTWEEIVSLEYGKALRDYKNISGRYRVFGSNGPVGWANQRLAEGPGVILGRKGAYRGVEYSQNDFYVIDTAYYLKPKIEIDMRWLYYAVIFHKLGEIDDGSPIPSTTRSAVYVRKVSVPPIATQRLIANILGSIDDRIELYRRANKTLESIAQSLFKDWFIDFGPVRAKLAGRESECISPEVFALFPDKFCDSELGEIPDGWSIKSLEDLIESVSTTYPLKSVEEVVFLNTGDIQDGKFLHCQKSSTKQLPGQAKKSIKKGDILYSEIRPENKRYAYVYFNAEEYVVSTKLMVLRTKPNAPDSVFIYHILKQQSNIDFLQMMAESRSGTFPQITFDVLSKIKVLLPSDEILNHFVNDILMPQLSKATQINNSIEQLSNLRDSLLSKLLSGELTIPKEMLMKEKVL